MDHVTYWGDRQSGFIINNDGRREGGAARIGVKKSTVVRSGGVRGRVSNIVGGSGLRWHGKRGENGGRYPHGVTRRGAGSTVATKLTTSMGGRDDNVLIVETISTLWNTSHKRLSSVLVLPRVDGGQRVVGAQRNHGEQCSWPYQRLRICPVEAGCREGRHIIGRPS